MEPITPAQTDNAPVQAPVPRRKHRLTLVVLGVLAGILYIAGNIWFSFRITKKQTTVPPAIRRFMEQGAQSTPSMTPSTPTPIPTPTPTPRPTGPGPLACAPDGTCNRYGEEVRRELCPVTFADERCLDSCGDPAKRCKK